MGRGAIYTEDEEKALLALYEDSSETEKKKKKYLDIVKRGQRYGICSDRTPNAVVQHLSKLIEQTKDDSSDDKSNTDFKEEANYWELEANRWRNRSLYYEKLNNDWLEVIFGKATGINEYDFIQWDFRAITRYARNEYPEKYSEVVEYFKMNEGGTKND